jgi:hypothetical protein
VVIYLSALGFPHRIGTKLSRREIDRMKEGENGRGEEVVGEGDDLQKITVSAAVRLIPNPPARVERQKTKISGLVVSSFLDYSLRGFLPGRREIERGSRKRPRRLLRSLLRGLTLSAKQ